MNTLDDLNGYLSAHKDDGSEAYTLIVQAVAKIEYLTESLGEAERENETLEGKVAELDIDIAETVDTLLDCMDHPVGTLAPVIPDTPASRRAIVALYDAVNRNL